MLSHGSAAQCRQLGAAGIAYVRDKLGNGDELANQALTELSIDEGQVTVGLPIEVDLSRLDLRHGPLRDEDLSSFDLWGPSKRFVRDFLKEAPERVLVCQCMSQRMTEPVVFREPLGWFTHAPSRHSISSSPQDTGSVSWKDMVVSPAKGGYCYLTSDLAETENIDEAFRWTWDYPFLGFLTSISTFGDKSYIHEVDTESLRELAKKTQHVLIGAYDMFTVVIWSKADTDVKPSIEK